MKTICLMATVLLFLLVNTQEFQSQDNGYYCDVDLYICLDVSSSLANENLEEEKNFIKNYIDELKKKVQSIKKIKVIPFAGKIWDDLPETHDIEKAKSTIDGINRTLLFEYIYNNGTMPNLCLEKVSEISGSNNERQTNTKKILLLSSDGIFDNYYFEKMKVLVEKMKYVENFIVQAAVYIGPNTQKLEEMMNSANVYSRSSKNNIALEALEISPCSKLETCPELRLNQSNHFDGIPKNCTGIRVGENCDFECPGELKPNEYKTIRCLVGSTWGHDQKIKYCVTHRSCQITTKKIDKGYFSMCKWRQICEIYCIEGYTHIGHSECRKGVIDGNANCQRNPCDTQKIIKGNIRDYCKSKKDCSDKTNCELGYKINPSHQFLCDTGRKTINDNICINKTCKGITFGLGSINENCQSGIDCVVGCKEGYKPVSTTKYQCDDNGEIIHISNVGLNSLCVKKNCTSSSNNAYRIISDCYTGLTCKLTCNPGYVQDKSLITTCQADGIITHSDEVCKPIVCPGRNIGNGELLECTFGKDECDFKCNHGYVQDESLKTTCQANGIITHSDELCKPIKCPGRNIGNGELLECTFGKDKCDFKCDLGYSNQGAFKCRNDGKFETGGICVADTCRDKPDIPNGVIYDCKTGEGCDTVCNRHYRKNAVREFFCTDGVYVGNVTCSLITCSHTPHLPNATEVSLAACVTNSRAGEDCQHLCAHGFAHFGTLRCDADGNWNTSAANCTRVCSLPPEIEHSDPESPKNCANAFENQTCPVTCAKDAKTGFTPVCARKSDADPALVWKNTKYACYIAVEIQPYTLITSIMTTASFAAAILSLALAVPKEVGDLGAALDAFYNTAAGDALEFTIADPEIFILE